MSKIISKLKEIFCNIPTLEITPERETELIDKIAATISKHNLELPTIFLGSGFQSTSTVLSQMLLLPMTPYLEAFGISGYDYVALFSNKDNVRRLMEKLDEIYLTKEMTKEAAKEQAKEEAQDKAKH